MATVIQTKDRKIKLSNGGWAKIRVKLPMSVQYKAAQEAKEKYSKNTEYMAGIILLTHMITKWDLVDENKKPIPINFETVDAYLTDKDAYSVIGRINKARKLSTEKKSS